MDHGQLQQWHLVPIDGWRIAVSDTIEEMRREFEYKVDEETLRCVAEDADAFFGKGIRIRVLEENGLVRDRLKFNCHPEFEGFAEFQSKSHDELASIAIDRLNTGRYESSLTRARTKKLELLLRFNGEDVDT